MRAERVWPSAVFLALWGVYSFRAAPSVMTGDSAELATAAASLGVAHSPGYPLYVLGGKMFDAALPWGNPAYAANLFSGFAAALALALLCRAWGPSAPVAAALALAGTGPLFLTLTASAEVFGLNALAAAALAAVVVSPERAAVRLALAAFLLGLGLGNQHTLVLAAPGFFLAARALWARVPISSRPALILAAPLLFAAGLSVYAYLYLRSKVQPLLDWEDPETLDRFWAVISRARYGTLQLAQGETGARSWAGFGRQLVFFGQETLSWLKAPGLVLAGFGLWRVFRRNEPRRAYAAALLAAVLLSGPLFLHWANVRPTERSAEILERFLLLPAVFVLFFVAAGAADVFARGRAGKAAGWTLLFLWVAMATPAAAGPGRRWDLRTRRHAVNVLRCAPPSAHLFADRADETEFALAYLQGVERRRPDVDFVDANAGVSRSLYGGDYYGVWGRPRLERRAAVEGAILANSPRSLYYATLDLAQLPFPRRAAGVLFETARDGKFSARTAFPYWDVMVFPAEAPDGGRARHLDYANGRLLGEYALSLGDAAVARRFFGLAERAGGDPWRIHLAAWHQREGRADEAERLYRAVLRRPGRWPLVWNNLGALESGRGRWEAALECYARAIELDPRYAEAHFNAAVVRWHRSEWREAAAALERVLEIDPAHAGARRYLDEARRRAAGEKS